MVTKMKKVTMLIIAVIITVIMATIFSVGCKQTTTATTAAVETTAATTAAVETTAAAETTTAKQIKVRYICLVKGIPYFDPIIEGMKVGVETLGGIYEETAPDAVEATAQIPLIEAAIQDQVDVICISPASADALNSAVDKARQNGVKVLAVNDDLVGNETHRDAAIISCNYDQLAIDSFEAFAKSMNYKGEFVVLSASTEQPFQNNQIAIYKKMMSEDPKYKDMKLLEVLYGNDEATKSLTEAETAIQKYPNLGGIMAPTSIAIVSAAQAVENKGLQDKIAVYGLGTPSQCKDFIKSGVLKGAMLWDTFRTGEVGGIVAVELVKGTIQLTPGTSFEAGKYGKTDINDKNIIYAGPPLEFNKSNVDNYNF